MCVLSFCLYSCICCLLDLAELSCNCVGEASLNDICFFDCVSCCCCNCLASCCFELALCQGYTSDLGECDGACLVIDVSCSDGECYFFAKCIRLVLCSLIDYECRIYFLFIARVCSVSDGQCSVLCSDCVVVCLGSLVQSISECVLTASDECLCSGYFICSAFACCESVAAYCNFIICECCSVIDLAVCSRCQLDLSLADLE